MPLYDVRVKLNDKPFAKLKQALRNIDSEPELVEAFAQWQNIYRAFSRRRFVQYSRGGGDWKPLAQSTIDRRRGGTLRSKTKKKKPTKKKAAKRKKAKKAKRPQKRTIKRFLKNTVSKTRKAKKATARAAKTAVKKYKAHKRQRGKVAREKKARLRVSHAILRDTGAMFATFQPEIVKPVGILDTNAKLGLVVRFGGRGKQGKVNLDDLMYWHHTGAGRRLPARKLLVGPDQATADRMARTMERAFQKVLNRRANG